MHRYCFETEFVCCVIERSLVATGNYNLCACLLEQLGGSQPYSAAAAGDYCNFSFESLHSPSFRVPSNGPAYAAVVRVSLRTRKSRMAVAISWKCVSRAKCPVS